MSSNRGRKRNDNLPPNPSRDIQREFRARRTAHLQTLEQRIKELEDENKHYREALDLPPSSRPSLGSGPTGRDRPCREMTMGVGPPHRTMVADEHCTSLSERGHPVGESIPIGAPMPVTTPGHSDRTLPPLHSLSIAIYPQKTTCYFPTSDAFIESNFDTSEPQRRKAPNEDQQNLYGRSPNYPNSDQYLHTVASMNPEPYHDPNLLHREWNFPPSNHVHPFQDQGFSESLRFPRPREQVHPSHTFQRQDLSRSQDIQRA